MSSSDDSEGMHGQSGWSLSFGANQTQSDSLAGALTARHDIANLAGLQFGGDRDLYDVLGWKRHPTVRDYWATYLRNPLGRVIVNAPAATAWRVEPEVDDSPNDERDDPEDDTQFERAVSDLFEQHRVMHYMERADKVSGIGQFGVIVLGYGDDAEDMETPVETGSLNGLDDLHYISTFSEERVDSIELDTDPLSERYGLPEFYDIEFDASGMTHRTHWTRVIHVAEDLLEDEIYGRPRLEATYNTLFDLEKVLGGAAEMTWRGAGLRMQLNIDPEMGQVPDADSVAEQAEEMVMGLRHIMRTRGTDMNIIEGQTVDPSGITGELLKLVAGETGIPQRILTGSERGELASTQDRATFFGRIGERQRTFCEPQMLRPFIDRLVDVGILPEPNGGIAAYEIEWPALFELSEVEQVEVMEKMANALAQAAPAGDTGQLATTAELRAEVFGWDPERGAEVDEPGFEDPELREEEDEALPETPEDREIFEEIFGDMDDVPADVPIETDGGADT